MDVALPSYIKLLQFCRHLRDLQVIPETYGRFGVAVVAPPSRIYRHLAVHHHMGVPPVTETASCLPKTSSVSS